MNCPNFAEALARLKPWKSPYARIQIVQCDSQRGPCRFPAPVPIAQWRIPNFLSSTCVPFQPQPTSVLDLLLAAMGAISLLNQDIFDLIIDATYSSFGIAPLKKLSVVSTAWRTRSQVRIFRKFSLHLNKMEQIHSETSEPIDVLMPRQRFPSVFAYVRELKVAAFEVHPRGVRPT